VAKPQQINGSFGRLSARYRPWKTIPDVAESGRGSVYWAMRLTEVTSVLLILAAACGHEVPVHSGKKPPVAVAAQATLVHALDSVTFIARIRSDIAGELRRVDHPGDPAEGVPHIVGWQWFPDLGQIDPWTTACTSRELRCTIMVHGSGTMVLSVRFAGQVCADWVHVETRSVPDFVETDSMPRLRTDSIEAAIRTKVPSWPRCTA